MEAKPDDVPLRRKIWAVLTPRERKGAWFQLTYSIVGVLLETLGIGMVIPAVVMLVEEDPATRFPILRPLLDFLGNPSQAELIVGGMVALGSVYLIKTAFLVFLSWSQNRYAFDIRLRLSEDLYQTYLRQPYVFHLQRNSAFLIRNAQAETQQLVQGGLRSLMTLVTEFALLLGIGLLLIVVEPVGALTVVAVVGAAAWAFHAFTRDLVLRWGQERRDHDGMRMLHMRQGLSSVKELKLLGRESEFIRRYHYHNEMAAKAARRQSTMTQLPRLGLELIAVLGLVVLVLTMLAQGEDMASVLPTLGLFGAAAFRLLPSVNRILSAAQSIRFTLPVVDSIYEESQLSVPTPRKRTGAVRKLEREIALSSVSYTYPGGARPALVDVSLIIRKGESVGFIGPSGSGKTTVIDLLLGMFVPSSGHVAIDGTDIQEDLRNWQDQIGYVPQAIYLTDDTLRRNIAFAIADDEIDAAAVNRAIAAAQLEEFVASLPEGLDTRVGERGVRLSGGQRQRIGIARALYHDPAVLVLDEATSALDTATERDVMRAVTALHGTKTIVMIAHRLSTVEGCDRLYRLDQGRVVEEGPPGSVLTKELEDDLSQAAAQ